MAVLFSIIIAYIIHLIIGIPFTKTKLVISTVIPSVIVPVFVIPNYKQKKRVIEANRLLRESLVEKSILVQEVHHRVKNNLSIILSLLHLQKQTPLCKENTEYCLSNFERRVQTISLAHAHILDSPDFSTMNISNFIQEQHELINLLVDNPYRQIKFHIDPINVKITLENAVPIGLIISELLINSYQHAFQDRDEGKIRIRITKSDSTTILTFEDDGIGIPENLISEHIDTIGMTLISILADQIGGKSGFQNTNGTRFTLTFNN